jgi:hypothetical protein
MSAAEVETFYVTEIDRIEQWLAASHDIDLHDAVSLLERGCSVELALQILL